jgi:TRAP-type C4-dicarboxylate transport system permease small subunit
MKGVVLNMDKLKKIVRWFSDLVEVYLPSAMFVLLFLVFIANVFFRYVLKNPQNWTFELSVNAFVVVGLLGAATAHRKEDHVVFDLLYAPLDSRKQNTLRILSNALVILFFGIAIPGSFIYVFELPSMTSILKIPEKYIFVVFPIFLVSTFFRSIYRLTIDIKARRKKTYIQEYNTGDKESLI